MEVVSRCSLPVTSLVWQSMSGAWGLTVVCKGTYHLEPGELRLAAEQIRPNEQDRHWNDDVTRGIHEPSDLAPFKPRADVLVVGHAYAPQRRPVRSMFARVAVGEVNKAVEVWCDRIFAADRRLLEGQPFTIMSLGYELAAGGVGTTNPIGMRRDAPPDRHGAIPIPNLQPVGRKLLKWGEWVEPIGFGPVAPEWPERLGKLHRYAAGWSHRRWAESPVPADIDPGYFNAAPGDQQVSALVPGMQILLEGLNPQLPRFVATLPEAMPRAEVERSGRREVVPLACDTLWIDTDRGVCTLVWRGLIGLRHREEPGRVVVMMGEEQGDSRRTEMAVSAGEVAGEDDEGARTVMFGQILGSVAPVLPFVSPPEEKKEKGESISPWARMAWMAKEEQPVEVLRPIGDDGTRTMVPPLEFGKALPFAEVKAPEPAVEGEASAPAAVTDAATDAEKPPEVVDVPLEKCAAIAASIDRRAGEKEKVLEENKLTVEQWAGVEKKWEDAIDEEIEQGETELLQRFDAAYVKQLEEERGVITSAEYARLVVAAQRGTTEKVLAELGIPEEAEMRVERVWMGRGLSGVVVQHRHSQPNMTRQ